MKSIYMNNQIQNHLDERLVDCFCEQNQDNNWLNIKDVACWVFETNNPNSFHRSYVSGKLRTLIGLPGTQTAKTTPFDFHYDSEVDGAFFYRLKDPSKHIRSKKSASLEHQVDTACENLGSTCEQHMSKEVEEYPF